LAGRYTNVGARGFTGLTAAVKFKIEEPDIVGSASLVALTVTVIGAAGVGGE